MFVVLLVAELAHDPVHSLVYSNKQSMDFNSFNRELQCDNDIIDINLPLAGLSGKLERCERCAISLRSDSIGSRRQCGRGPQKRPFCWPLQELGSWPISGERRDSSAPDWPH